MSQLMESMGWTGSIAFALSAAPQSYKSWKDKHSNGISWGLITLWTIGEWASLIYVTPMGHLPLICNYLGNILFVGVITYYKFKPAGVINEN